MLWDRTGAKMARPGQARPDKTKLRCLKRCKASDAKRTKPTDKPTDLLILIIIIS